MRERPRSVSAMSIYEKWMEPDNGEHSSEQFDIDIDELVAKNVKVERKKNVPPPKKTAPSGKYRFHQLYLEDVSNDEIKEPEPPQQQPIPTITRSSPSPPLPEEEEEESQLERELSPPPSDEDSEPELSPEESSREESPPRAPQRTAYGQQR